MRRIQLDEDIKPLSEFRSNVGSFLNKVRETKRPLVITLHGKSAAVLIDVTEYESLLEKIELLEDIQQGERQVKEGSSVEHDEALTRVLKKIKK
jgi:prevent-host-death family protein